MQSTLKNSLDQRDFACKSIGMFISVGNLLSRSLTLVVGCSVLAALGCSTEPKIVDSEEPSELEAAGASAEPRNPRASSGKSSAASQGSAGSGAKSGTTSNASSPGDAEDAEDAEDAADDGLNYGWVKFENAPFGRGKTPNAQLRRPLQVTILGDEAMVGKGYVMRSSLDTSYIHVAIAISNSDSQMRCFVKAQDIVWRTEEGDEIPGDSHAMTYLSGSAGESSGTLTTTCLAPGEKGYLLELQAMAKGDDSLFETLAEVELTLSSSDSKFERPNYRVLPVKWSGSASSLSVTFQNMGIMAAPVELGEGQFIMTDADGLPLTWGFLDVDRRLTILHPGGEVVLKSEIYYDGKVSNMLVSFGY